MKCRKRKFRDPVDAQIALWKADNRRDKGSTKRREVRAYYCSECRAHHLTSRA